MTANDTQEFNSYLANCTNQQVEGVYQKEKSAGRRDYAELAAKEGRKRNMDFAFLR
jgi:hypothetical protein